MRGNSHVRFLERLGARESLVYPAVILDLREAGRCQ